MNSLINAPQDLMRTLALFRQLRADVEIFRAAFPGMFNSDPDLRALADDLYQKIHEFESQLSKSTKE